jgi:hypothetical protein
LVATYDLNVYAACYPAAVLSADGDLPSSVPVEFHECISLYALSFACLKLRRWGEAAANYNRYITSVQSKRYEYIFKKPEESGYHDLPASVVIGKKVE